MTQSTRELERDAERVRAQLAQTTEQLKEKMTPGQLMDEVMQYFKDGDSTQLLNNLRTQVRDNPMALAMVGAGFAWLMMGQGVSAPTNGVTRNGHLRPNGNGLHAASSGMARSHTVAATSNGASADHWSRESASSGESGSMLKEGVASVRDAVGNAAAAAGDLAASASDSVSSTMHDWRDAAGSGASQIAEAGAALGQKARTTFMDALEREPLILGALGLAAGAALGAMLPATRTEQEYLGPLGEQAKKAASETMAEGMDKAKQVAADVYDAARTEADRQGFTGGKPLSEKVSEVARAAGEELKSAAEETVAGFEPDGARKGSPDPLASNQAGARFGEDRSAAKESEQQSGLFRPDAEKPKF